MKLTIFNILFVHGASATLYLTEDQAKGAVSAWRQGNMGEFHTLRCVQFGSECTFKPKDVQMLMWAVPTPQQLQQIGASVAPVWNPHARSGN
jgi:hypothetical protein